MDLVAVAPHIASPFTVPNAHAHADDGGVYMGRMAQCAIHDKQVSRKQLKVFMEDGRVFVQFISKVGGAINRNVDGPAVWDVCGDGDVRQLQPGDRLAVKWTVAAGAPEYIYQLQRRSTAASPAHHPPPPAHHTPPPAHHTPQHAPAPAPAHRALPPTKRARTDEPAQTYCILLMVEYVITSSPRRAMTVLSPPYGLVLTGCAFTTTCV